MSQAGRIACTRNGERDSQLFIGEEPPVQGRAPVLLQGKEYVETDALVRADIGAVSGR